MSLSIELFERTVVFVNRVLPNRSINSLLSKYADLGQIAKHKIIHNLDLDNVEIDDNSSSIVQSIAFKDHNVRITGQPDRLIIGLLDFTKTDKDFYKISKRYSDILIKEDISAIGVNFNGIMEIKNASTVIKEKILKKCSPNILNEADTASFKLVHEDKDKKAMFTVSIEVGEIEKGDVIKKGILFFCNYHREIDNQTLMKSKMDEFQDTLEEVKLQFDSHKKQIEDFFNE